MAILAVCGSAQTAVAADAPQVLSVQANPPSIMVSGAGAQFSLLIDGKRADGSEIDLTRNATFRSLSPDLLSVSATGLVRGLKDGTGSIQAEAAGRTVAIEVTVEGSQAPKKFNFENDIVPLLSKFGCNSSGCHGKAEGQNGFKLSVFGFDPAADFTALSKEGRGRRVFPAAPERSLLLRKISGGLPHGGGVRLAADSLEYATLCDWIAAGLPQGSTDDPHVVAIEVSPAERVLAMGALQPLRVVARYSDGRLADVTSLAKYQSNSEALVTVDGAGLVTAGESPGQAAVMASYLGAVDVFRAIIPQSAPIENQPAPPEHNFIDGLVDRQLLKLKVAPSGEADDAEFLRRVYLDVIGTLPSAAEARTFLADTSPDRRARLVDALLQRPEFNDLWALWWADVLRVDRQVLGQKGAYAYYKWIRDSLAANKPLDQFAREILTAEGPLADAPQGQFYSVVTDPGQMASTLSQVFLGVRIACAQCHHHPHDRWSQSDYYGMQAFFTQVGRKRSALGEMLVAAGNPETRNPRTGELVLPHALSVAPPDKAPEGDRRKLLADWLVSPDNAWFSRNLANRVWAHFLGRGLVEPVDDVRATNPPTNPELLDALARHLAETGFDLRQFIRTVTASRVYQQSSRPNASNDRDEQNYSRALLKRIPAEVLLDAVCQTTGVGEKFPGVPAGYRAVQLWDSRASNFFLKLFGRPVRQSACECERNAEASVAQVLHLMNAPEIQEKLAHEAGTVARLSREAGTDETLADELYLTFFSRFPTTDERQAAIAYLRKAEAGRRQGAEDLAWCLLNSLEFVFNH